MKLVFILVDALKSKYLTAENMPFLFELSKRHKHIKNIIPSHGFCERSEIFTGLDCYDTGNFTAIGYDPYNSDYKKKRFVLKLANIASIFSEKGARFLLGKYRSIKRFSMKPYRIPYQSLNKFTLTEDGPIKRIHYETLFEQLDKTSLTYTLQGFTSLSDIGIKKDIPLHDFLKEQLEAKIDFIPIYIGDIDAAGHKYGEDIDSFRSQLIKVDTLIKELYEVSQEYKSAFAVLGDHGMVPVKKYVDIVNILRTHKYKLHTQYEMFLDSTIARFWFYDTSVAKEIRKVLENELSEMGIFIDKSNYIDYRIPLDIKSKDGKAIYGELLWCANPGVLISPDYFHSSTTLYKGMHGYLCTHMDDGTGLFVSLQPGKENETIERMFLKDICAELCKLLEVTCPNTTEWKREII